MSDARHVEPRQWATGGIARGLQPLRWARPRGWAWISCQVTFDRNVFLRRFDRQRPARQMSNGLHDHQQRTLGCLCRRQTTARIDYHQQVVVHPAQTADPRLRPGRRRRTGRRGHPLNQRRADCQPNPMGLAADCGVRKERVVHGLLPRDDNPAQGLTIAAVHNSLGVHPGRYELRVDGCWRPRRSGGRSSTADRLV